MDEMLKKIFVEVIKISPSDYSDALAYSNVASWDSLAHLTMVNRVQEEWGVEFEIDEIMEMENVGKIKAILSKKLGVTS